MSCPVVATAGICERLNISRGQLGKAENGSTSNSSLFHVSTRSPLSFSQVSVSTLSLAGAPGYHQREPRAVLPLQHEARFLRSTGLSRPHPNFLLSRSPREPRGTQQSVPTVRIACVARGFCGFAAKVCLSVERLPIVSKSSLPRFAVGHLDRLRAPNHDTRRFSRLGDSRRTRSRRGVASSAKGWLFRPQWPVHAVLPKALSRAERSLCKVLGFTTDSSVPLAARSSDAQGTSVFVFPYIEWGSLKNITSLVSGKGYESFGLEGISKFGSPDSRLVFPAFIPLACLSG